MLQVGSAMEVEGSAQPSTGTPKTVSPAGLLPEVEAYAVLLVVLFLVDQKQHQEVGL